MKKLLRNIALLLLPVLLYTGLFLYLEPNNFYGLRAETPSGAVFGALRLMQREPKTAIIVGDSRTAHLSTAQARAVSGIEFANLSFGGAGLAEEIELVEWMLEEYEDIDTVVVGLSFYTLNRGHGQNRLASVRKAMDNPLLYLTNLDYHLETLQMVPDWLAGRPLYGGAAETEDPATYTYQSYTTPAGQSVQLRSTVAQYLEIMDPILAGWQLNEEGLADLLALVDTCGEQGVRIVVVLPPVHPALKEYQLDGYGITPQMEAVVSQLKASGAEVYDYEFTNPPAYTDDMFYDGLHLDYERGLPVWTDAFFEELK